MKKVFISQPMNGRSFEELMAERNILTLIAQSYFDEPIEVIDSYLKEEYANPLYYIAESIKLLAQADAAIFAPEWDNGRGCRVERKVCDEYGIRILM